MRRPSGRRCAGFSIKYGNDEIKKQFLPRIGSGEATFWMAFSEPGAALTRAVYEKYGDEGIKTLQQGMERTGRELAKALVKHFDVRVGNGDVTDYAKFVDFFHQVSLMDTKTVELSPKRWVVHATSCPAAAQYKRIFPDFCPWVLVALDRGMSSVVNKKIKARMTEKCLARGDDYCEYIFELED